MFPEPAELRPTTCAPNSAQRPARQPRPAPPPPRETLAQPWGHLGRGLAFERQVGSEADGVPCRQGPPTLGLWEGPGLCGQSPAQVKGHRPQDAWRPPRPGQHPLPGVRFLKNGVAGASFSEAGRGGQSNAAPSGPGSSRHGEWSPCLSQDPCGGGGPRAPRPTAREAGAPPAHRSRLRAPSAQGTEQLGAQRRQVTL